MKKYFLHNGKTQEGPFSVDDLRRKGVTNKTMIWFDGIKDWTEAQHILELKEFLTISPPPFKKSTIKTDKKFLRWVAIIPTVVILLVICFYQMNKNPEIAGEWSYNDEYGSKKLIIFNNNYTIDGDYKSDEITYEIDDSHKPIWIDIVVFDTLYKEETLRIKGIYEFLNDSTFRMCLNVPEWKQSVTRPDKFEKVKTYVYHKIN